ncbi:TetR/AcrR family transcriptional regulator C-terminal domain-containing protein [Nocardiopsis dassonvillei]|uniref:TetR/AcrR family transcriptional regulator C-terminal domain-containing protein n=1 Tax=Nocardiopsis dassonvillei TaxID=2014 RepID=UPI00362BFD08
MDALPAPEPRRQALDRQRIIRAAVELLDEAGLDGLSTRRLADRLGVRSPTLYWHVRNKDELLDLVAEAVCADAIRIDETLPWPEQLVSGLRQFRALLLAHRDAAALLRERTPVGPHRLGHIDTTLRVLLSAGFSEDEAAAVSQLLTAHVLSSVEGFTSRRDSAGREARTENAGMEKKTDTEKKTYAGSRPGLSAEHLADHPHLRRTLPAFARLSAEEVFETGVEIIVGGLVQRARGRG